MNAGGGHKAPAQALARAMQALRGNDVQPELINLADEANVFLSFLMEDGYTWLIHKAPLLYALVYELSRTKPIIALEHMLGIVLLKKRLLKKIAAEKPDLIVSTYFLVEAISAALNELHLQIPLEVVVTEPYSVPPTWFYSKQIPYVVFSERARAIAAAEQVKQVTVFPPIVNNELAKKLTEDEEIEWRRKLGLDPDKKIVLLIGGGTGLPGGVKIMSEMLRSSLDVQFVVVCGNNKPFENRMRSICANSSIKVTLLGFVTFVPELISLSDIVISKAGAGVVAEIIAQHKPLLITHYIYGQEKGTMEYAVEQGYGWYEPVPAKAVQRLEQFFVNADLGRTVALHYQAKAPTSGTRAVAEYLLSKIG
jgi:processive 1,2-diacylglycerol beta-glucosyltransferase/1,2-diacylglycerol 3-beta-galactosyltransferase